MSESMPVAGSVDRDGFTLTYVREGSGIPMLVLGAPRYYRRALPAALRDHFEMVFCDLRTWVPSPDGYDITTITADTHVADIEAIRADAGLDRPVVLGHSIHAALALDHAARHPDQVRGVVAVAATPVGGGELWQAAADFFDGDADEARRAAIEQNALTLPPPSTYETPQDFVDQYVADAARYWYDPTFDARPLWEDVHPNFEAFMQLVGTYGDGYEVPPLDVPVLLTLGRYDYVAPYALWDEPRQRLSSLTDRLYERSGHTPPYEEPEAFTADLLAWAADL